MPTRTLTTARTRLLPGLLSTLVGLAGAVGFGVLSPAPAYASGSVGADTAMGAGQQLAATGTPDLDDDAVEALRRVVTAETAHNRARRHQDLLVQRVQSLTDQSARAAARAERLSARVDDSTTGLLLDAVASLVTGDDTEVDRAVDAVENEEFAVALLAIAERGLAEAELDLAAARRKLDAARAEAASVRTRAAAMRAARTAIERAAFGRGYAVDSADQDRRNRKALTGWADYLTSLGHAGIVPPHAEALADPDTLVEPFEPVHDRRGRAVPGVAEVDTEQGPLLVVPAETVRAVSTAFSRVGLGEPAETVGARDYACGGLATDAWQPTALGVPTGAPAQWDTLTAVPAAASQVGDLVYTASDGSDPSRVGVLVRDGLMVVADPATGVPAVQMLSKRQVLGVRRATVPNGAVVRVARSAGPECHEPAPVTPPTGTHTGWTTPVPGGYAPSTGFGVSGPSWSSGQHTGLDFSAPTGTAVYAARGGTVSVERPEWAGRLVRIDHGDGLETWYAHMSAVDVLPGQLVRAGERIGSVGSEGNSTGPHLHFEVRLDGSATDPAVPLGLAPAPQ